MYKSHKAFFSCLAVAFCSILLPVAVVAQAPIITSPLADSVDVGTSGYSYTITADNSPTSFAATSLPSGLSRSGATISGTPSAPGVFLINILAQNNDGFDLETLVLTVNEIVPVITSPPTSSGNVGDPFSYQITADNSPASFNVRGLDSFPGLTFDPVTGIIGGVPTSTASGDVILTATNSAGSGIAVLSLTVNAATSNPPVIVSSLSETITQGVFYSYTIEATNSPETFGLIGALPSGLSRRGNVISGVPSEAGTFSVSLSASNSFGTGTGVLTLEVLPPVPVISSLLSAIGQVNSSFNYQITADNNPTSFSALGLDSITGLSFDPSTGVISGTPTVSGDFDVVFGATNVSGTDQEALRIVIVPEELVETGPAVSVISVNGEDPASMPVFDAATETLTIEADVTPDPGETIEAVFVRWSNPPASANSPQIIVAELLPVEPIPSTGPIRFSGVADVGYNPNNREVGGGANLFEAVATQRNAANALSFGVSDEVTVEVAPLVEFLLPAAGVPQKRVALGDAFAAVKISTNSFQNVSASISGIGVIQTVVDEDPTDNFNGIFSFVSASEINFPGTYIITITATDSIGNSTAIVRELTISDDPTEPLAAIVSPTPGFTNDVFVSAIFTWNQNGAPEFTRVNGVITETRIEYTINQVTEGHGYFPYNASDQNLSYNFVSGSARISGNTITDGRLPNLPDSLTIVFPGQSSGYGSSGTGFVDSAADPGQPAQVDITAELVKADADLRSFKIFVNGEDVTPGNGNLNAALGPVDAPTVSYPSSGSPAPGDYVVVVQVTDEDGEVGTSAPVLFTIVPFEPLDVQLSRQDAAPVQQGETVTYFIDISPIDEVDTVEIFDSTTGESLGQASRVTVEGVTRYRFSQTYLQAGIFGIYAEATNFNGQPARSNSVTIQVEPVNDLSAEITSPTPLDGAIEIVSELFVGQSLNFTATATATPGIASFDWIVDNVVEETDVAAPYVFSRVFGSVGTFTVVGEALDNFGNRQGTEEVTVIVTEPALTVEITSPVGSQSVSAGESLSFTAVASSELSVSSVTWFVNDLEVESDTSPPYALSFAFPTIGISSVRAEAQDNLGNVATSANVSVEVNEPDPNSNDADFVSDVFNRLVGRVPSETERGEALALLDGTLESRVAYIVSILESDLLDSTSFVQIVYRTMTGEWPDASELAEARTSLTDSVSSGSTQSGSIVAGGTETFTFQFNAGNSVTVRVNADNSSGSPLTDATLTITDPNGNFVAFADDSFQGFNFNLDPVITFVPSQTGTYTATVGGFNLFQFGDFTITSSTVGSGAVGTALSAEALVTALIPEYEERFGPFLTDALGASTGDFVTQVFENKHGVLPTSQALARLGTALTGPNIVFNGNVSPGYNGDVSAFVAGFAVDNDLSGFEGAEGLPLSASLIYSRPNDATANAALALLVSSLLGEKPTDALIASFNTGTIAGTVEAILTDPRYFEQFPSNTVESFVSVRMAQLGVFDTSMNGPDADADSDGDSNLKEIALGTDPNDSADVSASLTAMIDGTDFVVKFIRIQTPPAPDGLLINVEYSPSLLPDSWVPASSTMISVTADQSGVRQDYERVEFRMDMMAQDRIFVRVAVDY